MHYIYTYREREREREMCIHIYAYAQYVCMYIYIYIYVLNNYTYALYMSTLPRAAESAGADGRLVHLRGDRDE